MKIYWTNTAMDHLLMIHEYASKHSRIYADRLVDRLTYRSTRLKSFPNLGRIVPEYGQENIREIIERPYRMIYKIKSEQIDILAILHSSQSFPDDLEIIE